MKNHILNVMLKIAAENGTEIIKQFNDETILLDSGLDSLGFAILIARLEEDLGYDPFTIMEEAVYPRTFGELVDIYERFNPGLRVD
jgi:acyl carrier protein